MTNQVPVFRLYPGEFGLLALMVVVSGYMWYGASEYDGLAGFFPRLMATIVFVMSALLLVRRVSVVPGAVQRALEGGTGSITDEVEESFEGDEEETEEEVEEFAERVGTTRKTTFLGLLTGAYMLFGYLFGILWGTPLYIIAYLRYTNYSWRLALSIAAVVTVIVYVMMDIFNFTLETGWVFRTMGIEIPLTIAAETLPTDLLPTEVI